MAATSFISQDGQCLMDLAIQRYGTMEAIGLMLEENPTLGSFTAVPAPGTQLVANYLPLNNTVYQFFQARSDKPANATGITNRRNVGKSFNISFNPSFR